MDLFQYLYRAENKRVITMNFVLFYPKVLSANLAKSGPLDFPSKKNFPLFFAHEKGLGDIFRK